ncbi:M48 family metallopeptidase [Lutispora sp.]|uniref:M48 family metallopeptidase n=1 Tax=Lutispora sp. TaxID=2828727 RepID=UPI002B200517|nr:SprT family zinc-dependent metalloprotease [Lutispora sp.]MEA4962915.1 SprT family zinc-dependent metalloprotease [Lutispora sp.]
MKLSFEYGTQTIEFEVEYKKRKTLGIRIAPPGVINIKAPVGVGEDRVLEIVKSKAKWIVQKLSEIKHLEGQKRNRQYVDGESFLYAGADYLLQIIYDEAYRKPVAKLENCSLCVYTGAKGEELIKSALTDWYKDKAKEKICERIEYYQPFFKITPAQIKVKEQKKRWGSCTSKRVLLFNWRIIMAPLNVMDYIIVHEMCHLIHMDHSKNFWSLVKSILPDYEERKLWLKINGTGMSL